MDWLQVWAFLEVLGMMIWLGFVVFFIILLGVISLTDFIIDRRKKKK